MRHDRIGILFGEPVFAGEALPPRNRQLRHHRPDLAKHLVGDVNRHQIGIREIPVIVRRFLLALILG